MLQNRYRMDPLMPKGKNIEISEHITFFERKHLPTLAMTALIE